MKLIRFGPAGTERPGVQLPDGSRIDASAFGQDYGEAFFGGDGLERLALWMASDAASAPVVGADVRLGPPIQRPSKIICVGLNYRDHAKEIGHGRPRRAGDLLQGDDRACGTERRRDHSEGQHEDGLGGRARGGDRQARELRLGGRRDEARRRIRPSQRLLGAGVPARARWAVGEGEELRHLRAARAVPRDPRRDRRRARPEAVARR